MNVTNDLFPNKEESAQEGIQRIRKALVIVGILALLIALFFQRIEDIVVTFKALGIGISPVIFYEWAGKHDKQKFGPRPCGYDHRELIREFVDDVHGHVVR